MPLPTYVAFRVELAQILANAAFLHTRKRECQAVQQTHYILAKYPISELGIACVEKQQYFEGELDSILDHFVHKYQETPLSTLEGFYSPGDAQDVANYGQELIDWISDIRKHLIQLKAENTKMLRDKEKDSELPNGSSLSSFLSYEQRLKKIHHSVVKFEYDWLKSKRAPSSLSKPQQVLESSPSAVIPNTARISCPKPNDSAALTERLDKIRDTLTTFRNSRPEFSSNLFQIHQKYQLESLQSPLSPQSSNTIRQAVNDITSECLPPLLCTAKSGYQQVLADNKNAFYIHLGQKLRDSIGLIEIVLGVTNAALMSMSAPEEGEIIE